MNTPDRTRTDARRAARPVLRAARQLLLVSRPALWINTVGVAVIGLWLAGTLWTWDGRWLTLLIWLTLPYNLLIYGLNDLSDRAEDALSVRKGGWQGARIGEGDARMLLPAIAALNVPFVLYAALTFPPGANLVLLASATLFALYSLPPVRFKTRPPLDSISNVAYAFPVVVPALLLGVPAPGVALLALMAWSVGKHAFDAAQDVSADRHAGVRTVATSLGVRGAALWALGWFGVAGAALWTLSPLSALSVWIVSGGLAARLLTRPDEAHARALYPASLLSPWIVGTVGGVQLVYVLARGLWQG